MQPHPEPSFLNSIQKIFLITGLTSFTIFILLGYDSGIWLGTEKTRFVPNKTAQVDTSSSNDPYKNLFDKIAKDAENGERVKDGYKIHWKTTIPFITFIFSIFGFFIFKDK